MIRNQESQVRETQESHSCYDRLLDELIEILRRGDDGAREAFLAEHPDEEPRLRSLLPTLRAMAEFEQSHTAPSGVSVMTRSVELSSGERTLGDFRILRELGRGGMGVVYQAEQISLRRQVALKILPAAALVDARLLQRFKNEVQAAALLQHTHIVPVYSVGCERGVHYYAMQYIEGHTLAEIIHQLCSLRGLDADPPPLTRGESRQREITGVLTKDIRPAVTGVQPCNDAKSLDGTSRSALVDTRPKAALSTNLSTGSKTEYFHGVARLMIQAAEALDHAHTRGILHRDVKPGNLMVDAAGTLWVTDFGLARLEADAGLTTTGDIVGTIRYMSPEQVLAKRVVVDHRTDIYSLGATLYELLALQPAYSGQDRQELLRQIAFEEPRRLRQLDKSIPPELDIITRKALEKNPTDRYETAQALADDLRRYLDNRPIVAKPPSLVNRCAKWSRRHVGIVWTLLAAALALVIVTGASALLIEASRDAALSDRERAEQERQRAEQQRTTAIAERNRAQRNLYQAEMVAGQLDARSENPGGLYSRLIGHLPTSGEADHRGWEWYYLLSRCRSEIRTLTHTSNVPFSAWSPDGKYLGSSGAVWDAATAELVRDFNTSYIMRYNVAWSPDGQKFAWAMVADESAFYVWDRASDRLSRYAQPPGTPDYGSFWCVAWSPDGRQIASGSLDRMIHVWDVASQKELWSVPTNFFARNLSWSKDGELLAAAIWTRELQIWNVARREVVHERKDPGTGWSVCWSPDGRTLAACGSGGWKLLDRDTWNVRHEEKTARGCQAIAYSPDGQQVAVAHGENVTVWDATGKSKMAERKGHLYPVVSVSWSPDGQQLVTADDHNEIKVWDLKTPSQPPRIDTGVEIDSLTWVPDQHALVTVARTDGARTWWDTQDGSQKRQQAAAIKPPFELGPGGALAALHNAEKHTLTIVETENGTPHAELGLDPGRTFHSSRLSPDGTRLVTHSHDEKHQRYLEFWDVNHERRLGEWSSEVQERAPRKFSHLLLSPDGLRLAAVGVGDLGDDGTRYWRSNLHVVDVVRGERLFKYLARAAGSITSLAWSKDGQCVALGTDEGRTEVIEISGRKERFTEKLGEHGISALAWHPSGARLACGAQDGQVFVVDSANGCVLLSFAMPADPVTKLAWSEDGERLVGATAQGQVEVWDASRGYALAAADGPRRGELAWMYRSRWAKSSGRDTASLEIFLRHAPDARAFWLARGGTMARLGRHQEAYLEYSKCAEPDMLYAYEAAFGQACSLLAAKDLPRFQEHCARLVSVFKDSPVPSNRGYVAGLCALTPNALVDPQLVLKLARFSLDANVREDHENGADHATTVLGASLYRAGQGEEALSLLTQQAAKLEHGGDDEDYYETAKAKYYLALIRLDRGHTLQAQRLLAEANQAAAALQPSTLLSPFYWSRPIQLDTLRQEVEGRLPPAAKPAAPETRSN